MEKDSIPNRVSEYVHKNAEEIVGLITTGSISYAMLLNEVLHIFFMLVGVSLSVTVTYFIKRALKKHFPHNDSEKE